MTMKYKNIERVHRKLAVFSELEIISVLQLKKILCQDKVDCQVVKFGLKKNFSIASKKQNDPMMIRMKMEH
jgi:hypothetical protein